MTGCWKSDVCEVARIGTGKRVFFPRDSHKTNHFQDTAHSIFISVNPKLFNKAQGMDRFETLRVSHTRRY